MNRRISAILQPRQVVEEPQNQPEIAPKVGRVLDQPLAETDQGGEEGPFQGETLTEIDDDAWLAALGPCGK